MIEKFQWHRFETHPEWVEEGCFAAGIPGEIRVIYRPKGANYDWSGPLVKNLEPTVDWHAYYFDPASGRVFDQGIIKATASKTEEAAKPLEYRKNIPSPQDWVMVLERVTARDGFRYTDPNKPNNKGCCGVGAQRRLRLRPWLNKPDAGFDVPYALCV